MAPLVCGIYKVGKKYEGFAEIIRDTVRDGLKLINKCLIARNHYCPPYSQQTGQDLGRNHSNDYLRSRLHEDQDMPRCKRIQISGRRRNFSERVRKARCRKHVVAVGDDLAQDAPVYIRCDGY